jgi:hypothetical protein
VHDRITRDGGKLLATAETSCNGASSGLFRGDSTAGRDVDESVLSLAGECLGAESFMAGWGGLFEELYEELQGGCDWAPRGDGRL